MKRAETNQALRERLRVTVQSIASFLDGSEAVFLEAGSQLVSLEKQALELVEATSLLGAGGATSARHDHARDFREIRHHLDQGQASAQSTHTSLVQLGTHIRALTLAGAGLQELTGTLRVLGTLTRIENAHSACEMATIAESVRSLAHQIETRFSQVVTESDGLERMTTQATLRSKAFLEQAGQRASVMIAGAETSLQKLEAISNDSLRLTEKAQAAGATIVSEVRRVIMALQVHDIARQMLEHVIAELREFEADGETAPAGWSEEVASICALEIKQLEAARVRLRDGLVEIKASMQIITDAVVSMTNEARALVGHDSEHSPLSTIEECIAKTTESLRGQLDLERHVHATMVEIAKTIASLAGHVGSVKRIGVMVKVLALNARLQTSRTGSQANVYAVIASEMTSVAAIVTDRSGVIAERLNAITNEATRLQAVETSDVENQLAGGDVLITNLERLFANLTEYHEEALSRTVKLFTSGATLEQEVKYLATHIEHQLDRLTELEAVEGALARLGHLETSTPASARVPSARFEKAKARYTMAAERTIHQQVSGVALTSPEALATSAPHEFGDNVDLF